MFNLVETFEVQTLSNSYLNFVTSLITAASWIPIKLSFPQILFNCSQQRLNIHGYLQESLQHTYLQDECPAYQHQTTQATTLWTGFRLPLLLLKETWICRGVSLHDGARIAAKNGAAHIYRPYLTISKRCTSAGPVSQWKMNEELLFSNLKIRQSVLFGLLWLFNIFCSDAPNHLPPFNLVQNSCLFVYGVAVVSIDDEYRQSSICNKTKQDEVGDGRLRHRLMSNWCHDLVNLHRFRLWTFALLYDHMTSSIKPQVPYYMTYHSGVRRWSTLGHRWHVHVQQIQIGKIWNMVYETCKWTDRHADYNTLHLHREGAK